MWRAWSYKNIEKTFSWKLQGYISTVTIYADARQYNVLSWRLHRRACNSRTGLVRKGKKVLLIDADPQGSLTLSLGFTKPDDLDFSLANVMERVVEDKRMWIPVLRFWSPLLSVHCFLPVFKLYSIRPSCRRLQPRSRVSLTTQVKERPKAIQHSKTEKSIRNGCSWYF